MKKSSSSMKLVAFDAARYLDSDEAVAEYMSAVLEANDPDLLLLALGDVARAKGMAQVAKEAGLGHCELQRDEVICIISARKATVTEAKFYPG